jgi:hypothetical protein
MSKCSLALTANAGVILTIGDIVLMIDALHGEKMPGFSTVPPDVLSRVWNKFLIRTPTVILATHVHPDHVSAALWDEARLRWPACFFLSPGCPLKGTIVLKEPWHHITCMGINIDTMRLPHEGSAYDTVVNYGYFLDVGGFTVLIPGDCAIDATPKISELIAGRHVDLALLNFPWVTLSEPRAFVQETIAPSHLALFHLPFIEDDSEGYRPAAFMAAKELSGVDVWVLSEPFQEVVINEPISWTVMTVVR